MRELIEYLYKAEGSMVHKNVGESDITSAGGIYKKHYGDARVFQVIDEAAQDAGVDGTSDEWTDNDIELVNLHINEGEQRRAVEEFYEEYSEQTHVELFAGSCRVAMFSMYVNSPKRAWKSVQQTLIDMKCNGVGGLELLELSKVDGKFGDKTRVALKTVYRALGRVGELYMEALMLSNMKSEYVKLATRNEMKYMVYLNGWINRMDKLKGK